MLVGPAHLRFVWYHPLQSPEMNFRPGRKKKLLDLFGGWVPAHDISLDDTEVLPGVTQPPSKILSFDFEPERDESNPAAVMIPFQVFDSLLDDHNVDVTGLSCSATKRGDLYRAHRLMAPAG